MKRKDGKKKIWWQKIGGGTLRLPNRIIKPNQKFQAFPDDIPESFRDVVIPLEEIPEKVDPKTKAKSKVNDEEAGGNEGVYKLEPVEGEEGLFNIVDDSGEPINEEPLSEDEANEYLETLN